MTRIKEIEARMAAIAVELEAEGADLDALQAEVRSLKSEKTELEAVEKRAAIRASVAGGAGVEVRSFAPTVEAEVVYTADSKEYRSAWLKEIAVDAKGNHLFGGMTKEERAAYTMVTTNTAAVVPTDIVNRVVELVKADSPLLADITITQFTRGFGVPRHLEIAAGDAMVVAEGVANADDEKDTFDLLPLSGVEIKKHVVLSKQMEIQSIGAFEDWLVTHLAARIRVAKEKHILAQLAKTSVGIAEGNKITGTFSDEEVLRAFSLINQNGVKKVYANSKTVWTVIAALKDQQGNKLFIPNSMADPTVAGRLYGADVKVDDNLTDNVILIGVPSAILGNDFAALEIVPYVEPKTLNRIYTGYALFDAGLENPQAFVHYTHQGE